MSLFDDAVVLLGTVLPLLFVFVVDGFGLCLELLHQLTIVGEGMELVHSYATMVPGDIFGGVRLHVVMDAEEPTQWL